MEWLIVFILGAVLLGPLLYAVITLCGLRQKLFYPILRVKTRAGRIEPMAIPPRRHDARE